MNNLAPHKKGLTQKIVQGLFFAYPISLAVNKQFNTLINALIFVVACFIVVKYFKVLQSGVSKIRPFWILALSMPMLLALIQYVSLIPPLSLREFDDFSRLLLCIPIYLSLIVIRPPIRYFLWGCLCFIIYTIGLMFWHMYVLGLERVIPPNGFVAIIPHTSIAIILSFLVLLLFRDSEGGFRFPVFSMLLLIAAFLIPLVTQTRSGIFVSVVLCVLFYILSSKRNLKVLLYGSIAAMFLITIMITQVWSRGDRTLAEVQAYVSQDETVLTSTTIRIELWRYASKMFIEHPFIGEGLHRFNLTLNSSKYRESLPVGLEIHAHPHNDLLRFAAEGGLVGVMALMMLYGVPLYAAIRTYFCNPRLINHLLPTVVFATGFFAAGIFDVILAWKAILMFFGITMSLLLAEMDMKSEVSLR